MLLISDCSLGGSRESKELLINYLTTLALKAGYLGALPFAGLRY